MNESDPTLVLFDGECLLCHRAVGFLLRNDPAGRLRFATLDSSAQTMVAVERGRRYVRSAAVLVVARRLRAPWPFLAALLGLVPPVLRDAAYDLVARHRAVWFGRAACFVPRPEHRERFL